MTYRAPVRDLAFTLQAAANLSPQGEDSVYARARDILSAAYPGRRVITVDARELFARGGGVHCITQQQPSRK